MPVYYYLFIFLQVSELCVPRWLSYTSRVVIQDVVGISRVVSVFGRPHALCILHVRYSAERLKDGPHQTSTLRSDRINHDKNIPYLLVLPCYPNLVLCTYRHTVCFLSFLSGPWWPKFPGTYESWSIAVLKQFSRWLKFWIPNLNFVALNKQLDRVNFIFLINESEEPKQKSLKLGMNYIV